jgi:hypothetical protein
MGKSEVSDKVPTASTNGRDKKYGSAFITPLNRKQLRYLVLHENFHVALKHCILFKEYTKKYPQATNIAQDFVVNALIEELDPDFKFIERPTDNLCIDRKYFGMSFPQVFNDLFKDAKEQPEDGGGGNGHSPLDDHIMADFDELDPDEQDEIKKQIDGAVFAKFEHSSVLKYFPTSKIGDGKQIWQRKFAEAPRMPLAQLEIEKLVPQGLKTTNGRYNLPRLNLSVELKEDEYAQRMSEGELPGHWAVLGTTMAKAVDKVAYQGKSYATGEVQCKAMADGAGTSNDDPIVVLNGTKKGLWTTTAFAVGDFGNLVGSLDAYPEFDGPRLLIRPSASMPAFKMVCPGLTTGELIENKADQIFTAKHNVGNDDPAAPGAAVTNLMTGEVEAVDDFELFCVNPQCWTWVYDIAPFTTLEHDVLGKRWIYQMEVHGALIPTVLVDPGSGTIYKALAKIDDCNNT